MQSSKDKKAFLSDQWKEIEENNRIQKTRDLFRKIRDIKGIFYVKMITIKDRNGMDLTEAKDTKRWQAYKEVQLLVNICCPCKKKKKRRGRRRIHRRTIQKRS